MTPNLNRLVERLEYVIAGGKVRLEHWDKASYIQFQNGRFCDEKGTNNGLVTFLDDEIPDRWLPYEKPVSEEKRREEFRAKFYALFAKADNYRGLYMTDNLAFFLFDTFALKEKP